MEPNAAAVAEPPFTLNVEGVMSDLPQIRPQELKIIGRCVHFRCDKPRRDAAPPGEGAEDVVALRRYYEGMVAFISRDTVMLLDAVQFTHEEELQRQRLRGQGENVAQSGGGLAAGASASGPTAEAGTQLTQPSLSPSSSSVPLMPTMRDGCVPKGCVIPYATFNRKKIRDVEFAPDDPKRVATASLALVRSGTNDSSPLETAGAASAASPTTLPNEQRLRMFVRRYLVHTSVNNNPTNITLVSFIAARTKWAAPDTTLLRTIAAEELAALQKVDEEIMKQRDARSGGRSGGARGSGAAVHDAHAGDGPAAGTRQLHGRHFADESALYNTGIPAKTSYTAVAHLATSITLLLYSAASFSSAEQHVVYNFIQPLSPLVAVAGAVSLFLGGTTGYHALKMKFPLNLKPLGLRLFFLFGSTGFMLCIAVMASLTLFASKDLVEDFSLAEFHRKQVVDAPLSVCNFNAKYRCSGFTRGCFEDDLNDTDLRHCPPPDICGTSARFSRPCEQLLKNSIKDTLLPVVILMYIASFVHFIDWVMLFRMFNKTRALERRLEEAQREPV